MEIYRKLAAARAFIKASPIKKAGRNKYSEYDYFTPDQINLLVHQAEVETGLIHLFSMKRDSDGLHGHLQIVDIETNEIINFIQATDIPAIKATNISQQIGGAVTYTNRYMLMTAYEIADNTLDFDAKDNREKEETVKPTAKPREKKSMTDDRFADMMSYVRSHTPIEAGNAIGKARLNFTFDEDQENIIKQWEDNL